MCVYIYRTLWYGFPPGIVNGFDTRLYPSISFGTHGSQVPQMHVGKLENRHGKAIFVITLGAFCIKLSTMRGEKCWESWPIPYCSNPKAVLRDSEKYANNQDMLSQCFIVSPAMMDTPMLPFHLGKYHRIIAIPYLNKHRQTGNLQSSWLKAHRYLRVKYEFKWVSSHRQGARGRDAAGAPPWVKLWSWHHL